MPTKEIVLVIPKCKRAKERIKQHGINGQMELFDAMQGQMLFKSLEKTWSNGGVKQHWFGWFTHDQVEVKFRRS